MTIEKIKLVDDHGYLMAPIMQALNERWKENIGTPEYILAVSKVELVSQLVLDMLREGYL